MARSTQKSAYGLDRVRRAAAAIATLFIFVCASWAHADEPIGPDPSLSPENVVSIQLEALQHNDVPSRNAGIRQTWMLAHPDNRRVTGPLLRFEQMIRGDAYRPLIDHAAHNVERVNTAEQQVTFIVTIETPEGKVLEYLWAVGRVREGPNRDSWMTTSVSPPRPSGRAI